MATQKSQKTKTGARPGRALAGLLALVIVMLLGIVGSNAFSPGHWKRDFKVQLGLDLSSGAQATLTAQTLNGKPISPSYMKEAIAIMIARVNGAGFSGAQVQQQGNDSIVVTVPGKNANSVVKLVGQTAELLFRQVLLIGPSGATATKTSTSTPTTSPTTLPTTSPTTSPTTQVTAPATSGSSSSPQAAGGPGAPAQTGAQGLASGSRLLAAAKPKSSKSSTPTTSSSPKASTSPSTSPSPTPTATTPTPSSEVSGDSSAVTPSVLALFNKLDCSNLNTWKSKIGYTPTAYDNPNSQIVACAAPSTGYAVGTKFVLAAAKVLGKDVTGAQAGVAAANQSLSSKWQVNVSLNGAGSTAFGNLTSELASKYYANGAATSVLDQVAIVLDGQIVSAPDIESAIPGGQAQITYFTQSEASLLAQELNYGSLPVTLHEEDVVSVSPQLGHDQLVAGLVAAAIGLGLVVLYCFLYYRGLGIVSVSSLIIASLLAYGSVVLLSKYAASGFSLELSGIAGLIVAIGITADSFVVFFERLRDEVREGKSLRPAVESGWKRARRTILVSDTVSFLCALLLWYFSVSDVKGFAFTLGLTTVIDVIVVFLFTKPMLTLLARTRFFGGGHPLSGLDPVRLGARTPWRSGVARRPRTSVKEA